jgi:hypothetical protein
MRYLRITALLVATSLTPATEAHTVCAGEPPSAVGVPDYVREVKPLLARKCHSCHGALKQSGGLRLDTRGTMFEGGASGAAVVAGNIDASLLITAIRGTGDTERMPLESDPLEEAELALLEHWIAAGAAGPDEPLPPDPRQHWSFQPLQRPAVPTVRNSEWARGPIDAFVAAEHQRRGLTPRPAAEPHTLLRRVFIDLIGLPPTPEEMQVFLNDAAPDAYERAVDRLLASPEYAERWARHWMDVWRYSDWDGYRAEVRESQPHIWRWRDWIVESLAADKPYDQMIVEMLSGDELAPDDPATIRATGFLVRNWFKFNRNVWLENTVEHTAKAFLGLTVNCAKCHDHFFDPISQREYYSLRAFFEPLQVRTDRVPGSADINQDGLVRVYDAADKAETFLFKRGNEAAPDKAHPCGPVVPRLFGATDLKIAAIDLPLTAYYPGFREFERAEALAGAQDELENAKQALPTSSGDGAVLAHAKLETARASLAAVEHRLAADAARFSVPPAVNSIEAAKQAAELEKQAILAERQLARARSEQAGIEAEQGLAAALTKLATARQTALLPQEKSTTSGATKTPADLPKFEQAVTDAEKKLAEARQARLTALAKLTTTDGKYSSFGQLYPTTSSGRRLALAKWIASQRNPLAARVAVNHIWLRHFGEALVASTFDFGRNGRLPTNQPLLDWLACELIAEGWRMKPIHRLIVTSQAYRMTSADAGADDPNRAVDPENLYLWRMNLRRMESEVVRDSILSVAGRLDRQRGGPDLDPALAETSGRRSLYFRHAKEKMVDFLDQFDRPNVSECYRRSDSIVPQQALAVANSSLSLVQARILARELTARTGAAGPAQSQVGFVGSAFERILNRAPRNDEERLCDDFLRDQAIRLSKSETLHKFTAGSASSIAPADDPEQRARENLVHVLLNHNDFVTIR